MKIIELSASGFMRLEAVTIRPDGAVVSIEGPNGGGKTSVLEAIHVALKGKAAAPPVPINKTMDRAVLRLDTGEYVVERTFTKVAGKEYTTDLKITAANGVRAKRPQELLDSLLGDLSFDPAKFLDAKPPQQFAMLKKLVPTDLDEIDVARQKAFEERTGISRQMREAQARADGIVLPEGPKPQKIDVAATLQEIERARAFNADQMTQAALLVRERQRLTDMRDQIAHLREQLAKTEQAAMALEENLACEPDPEPQIDIAPLHAKIAKAQDVDRIIASFDMRAKAMKEADDLGKRVDALTSTIEACDGARDAAIAKANLPVKGLGLADGMVTFEGLPLEQAETAVQLRVAVAVAAALNPTLRVILVREGSLLDTKNRAALAVYAEEHELQLWVESVRDAKGSSGVWISEGKIG